MKSLILLIIVKYNINLILYMENKIYNRINSL